ncbi:MAG: M50 family metallopeptidase [Anaerolineae bacterium]|nr:M50 family metallopeptidase [Anaerolineae bacterium]
MLLTLVSFLVVISILVFVHELGHFLVAKRNKIIVEEFAFGFPPRLIKLGERNGTVYAINAIPFGGYVKLRGEDDPSEPGSFAAAPKRARFAVLLAGVAMNFLLAVILFAAIALLNGMPDASRPGALIQDVVPGTPAEAAGLQPGDRIVGADGTPIRTTSDLQSYTRAHLGQPVVYTVVRRDPTSAAEQTLDFTIVPRTNPPKDQGALGIAIGVAMRPATLPEALWTGVRSTASVIAMTFLVPAALIREGRPISDAGLMGPVGIAVTTGDVVRTAAARQTVQPVLFFVALLSASVGIINLLPVPGLDGGRLIFVVLEAIRGRRIEPAREGLIHLIGIGLLLLLAGFLTLRDVTALITGTFPSLIP